MLLIGFDVETVGDKPAYALQPFRAKEGLVGVSAASVYLGENSAGRLDPPTDYLRIILRAAKARDAYVTGWNVAFDAAWCIALGLEDEVFSCKWLDAMLLWRHLTIEPENEDTPKNKRKSYALKAAVLEFYPDEAEFKDFEDFQATDDASLQRLLHRNKKDAELAVRLAGKFLAALTPQQRKAALVEARCIPLVARTYVTGIALNGRAAADLDVKLAEAAAALDAKLKELCPEASGINFGSAPQLQTLLYETWGLPAGRFSKKTGAPSTDKFALFDLALLDPRARMLKELREAKNNRVKYAQGSLRSLEHNGDGNTRPFARIFGTYTSRMTYSSGVKSVEQVEKTTKAKGLHLVERKAELPTGIALHQWKRGKEYRRIIEAPEGYTLCEFDFAGQEFRWMAVAANDPTMLSLCAPGEDAHSYMGAQIAREDYRDLLRRYKEGEDLAANHRKLGKFCVAEGEPVLTNSGLKPIEKVSLDDLVWDGVEWVTHSGVIPQGDQEVLTYDGLTLTPAHQVYLESGERVCFGRAATQGYRLCCTGIDGLAVRAPDSVLYRNSQAQESDQSQMPVCMRQRVVGTQGQPAKREVSQMSKLCFKGDARKQRACTDQQCSRCQSSEKMQRHAAAVRESSGFFVQELRSQRDSLRVFNDCRGNKLCPEGTPASNVYQCGHRQDKQQLGVCSREFEAGHACGESSEQEDQSLCTLQRKVGTSWSCVPCLENLVAGRNVCASGSSEFSQQGAVDRGYSREILHPFKLQTKRTYDVTNAGSRHRYTVSGRLIANSNLSFQYRVSAKTATVKARVDYELDVDEMFIRQILATYKQSYPGVPLYWTNQIFKCRQLGYAETYAGRRVQLTGSWAGRDAWPMESTAINYPIQGTGGDQKYLALAVARNLLPKFGGYFYYELHDGIFFIFPNGKALSAAAEFKRVLSALPYKQVWGVDLPIAFPVDAKLGPSWGDLKELKE